MTNSSQSLSQVDECNGSATYCGALKRNSLDKCFSLPCSEGHGYLLGQHKGWISAGENDFECLGKQPL